MKHKTIIILILLICSLPTSTFSQRVGAGANSFTQRIGVVLSGGGATGLAHVGVLMALEEAEIPIDYIAGTSAGALVGSMYACGFSPREIQAYILSDKFLKMSLGGLESQDNFLLRKKDDNASMLHAPFSKDSIFKSFLPTNFITPSLLDYEMFNFLGVTGAAVNEDFDSLFVPFRCVASDITKKESVVFKDGKLNAAVRASMTYPFYVNPIRIDGTLLFDGGLYNNFPAEVLYECFNNDYIIGSNVSFNALPPNEHNLISQVTNMLMQKTDFSLPCDNGIIISPELEISTFDFSNAERAINKGYEAAQTYIDSIRLYVDRTKTVEELNQKRKLFKQKISALAINEIHVSSNEDLSFVKSSFIGDSISKPIDEKTFSKRFFRAYSSPQIKYIYPTLEKNSDSTHRLYLEVTKEKPFELRVGGHFSSRPVNTGYIGLSYYDIGAGAVGVHGESYFGKFYGSTKIHINYDMPTLFPFRVTPYFTLNRWDYFRSFSTFFEDVKPSFLVQNEMYYGLQVAVPTTNTSKISLDFREFKNNDEYYQTLVFNSSDTADITNFNGQSTILQFEQNTLNKKQWANEGALLKFSLRYIQGKEQSISGTTTESNYDLRKSHRWVNLSLEGQQYFKFTNFFKLGLYGKSVFNSQSLFSNYTASILTMTEFSPLPDSKTFFMTEYRAPQFAGAGLNLVFSYNDLIDFRLEPYFFQPFRQIVHQENGGFGYSDLFEEGTFMAGASLIFHTPVGPLRLSTNYFPKQDKPFSTQISFGYVLFNERAIR